jgi:hypothetical protein
VGIAEKVKREVRKETQMAVGRTVLLSNHLMRADIVQPLSIRPGTVAIQNGCLDCQFLGHKPPSLDGKGFSRFFAHRLAP